MTDVTATRGRAETRLSASVERMAAAARRLQRERDPQSTMDAAVRLAAANVRACDAAAITLVHRRGRLFTPAYTDDDALGADMLQYELRQGPCLQAAWEERIVHASDIATDPRWPAWGPRITRDHGINSVLCLQLFTDDRHLGALNLYARAPRAFEPQDRDDGLALAAHIAVAVAAAQEAHHLAQAMDNRTIIGQACGILMERYRLDSQQAFDVLTRISSQSNVRVRDVARDLVDTRHLPGTP